MALKVLLSAMIYNKCLLKLLLQFVPQSCSKLKEMTDFRLDYKGRIRNGVHLGKFVVLGSFGHTLPVGNETTDLP